MAKKAEHLFVWKWSRIAYPAKEQNENVTHGVCFE